ncbi:hypothetical protein VHUM_02780 [Vanrija humicola]|uniref:Uncharacterized protein n=1 Tax=Vanrija humicola TaxID=5417 RepID=A0A7D8UZS1_VANHU|nr:hypothetical protein VHUM_02780 [Vanrija humicola]
MRVCSKSTRTQDTARALRTASWPRCKRALTRALRRACPPPAGSGSCAGA